MYQYITNEFKDSKNQKPELVSSDKSSNLRPPIDWAEYAW